MAEALAHLRKLTAEVRSTATPLNVFMMRQSLGTEMKNASLLSTPMTNVWPASGGDARAHQDAIAKNMASIVGALTSSDVTADRSVGSMMGLVIGDAVGAPVEFIPADSSLPPYTRKTRQGQEGRVAWLESTPGPNGELVYPDEYNKFRLLRGQWTDDAAMALCIADSEIVKDGYHGGDVRCRYHCWWNYGYNNAFRFDKDARRTSVGLGGNISKSLDELMERYPNKNADDVPSRFDATGEDAGNGSIMRLAPVPIRYSTNEAQAKAMAIESSFATHPGNDAAACCEFMAMFISRAIHRKEDAPQKTLGEFIDYSIAEYTSYVKSLPQEKQNSGHEHVLQVLHCNPPSEKEACWKWREPRLRIEETLAARGRRYNGYPVNAGYFGSYCMDGLAMALWALHPSKTFEESIVRVVNLLGDADTTAAIAGQMSGAFYGWQSFHETVLSKRMIADVAAWDPFSEIPVRALMLWDAAQNAKAAKVTDE